MVHWYALYTRPRHEKKVYDALIENEQEVFLPLIKRVRQWKDRKKKVDMPLFPSYLFVHFDYKYRFPILHIKGVVKIVNFKGTPAIVPDWQIDSLKKMLTRPELIHLQNYIQPGELVEVLEGPFKGMRGSVKIIKGESRLIVSIEGLMQTVSVDIDAGMLKKVGGNDE